MLCVCATFGRAIALCSQVRQRKVNQKNIFAFLCLAQLQRCVSYFFFLFYMVSREKSTPVKVETMCIVFMLMFPERDSVSCSSLRRKHRTKYPAGCFELVSLINQK